MEGSTNTRGLRLPACVVYCKDLSAEPRGQSHMLGSSPSGNQECPMRDTLISLNATLNTSPGVVGTCAPGSPPHRASEDGYFRRLVEGHGLVALNTWVSGSGLTFHTTTMKSQVEYILVPKTLARGDSKQSELPFRQVEQREDTFLYRPRSDQCDTGNFRLPLPPLPPFDKAALEEAVRYGSVPLVLPVPMPLWPTLA